MKEIRKKDRGNAFGICELRIIVQNRRIFLIKLIELIASVENVEKLFCK